jgi:photosystem II stability/assembly factor-like uncharacterized protein
MRPFSQGIMRSTDGGQTWQQLGASVFANRCVSDILIDPENPNIITACTGWGPYQGVPGDIWRSTDGGETWTQVNRGVGHDARIEAVAHALRLQLRLHRLRQTRLVDARIRNNQRARPTV